MSVSSMPAGRRNVPAALLPIGIAVVALATLLLLPRLGQGTDGQIAAPASAGASGYAARIVPTPVTRAPGPVWGNNIKALIPLQKPIEQMPGAGPYVFRVTELEMEAGAQILPHRQIGPGAHLVMRGSITIDDLEHGTSATYQ